MSSPRFFGKFRRGSRDKGPESPPKHICDELDGPAPSSYSSSLSSTVYSAGGLSSTPPGYPGDGSTSPLSQSPSTPRKDWEVNYKSYLSHISDEKSGMDSSGTASDASKHHRSVSGPSPVPELPYLFNSQSLPKHIYPDAMEAPRFRNSPPTHTVAEAKASTLDSSVRGGNLFKSMFKGGKATNGINRHRSADNNSLLDASLKKNVSCGTLDRPIRSGVSVLVKHRNQSEDCDALHRSEIDCQLKGRQVKSGFFRNSSIVIGPRNGSNRREFNGRKDKRRQQKVAFTEIHNDSKESAAAYLGEEKSVVRGKNFATLSKCRNVDCIRLILFNGCLSNL